MYLSYIFQETCVLYVAYQQQQIQILFRKSYCLKYFSPPTISLAIQGGEGGGRYQGTNIGIKSELSQLLLLMEQNSTYNTSIKFKTVLTNGNYKFLLGLAIERKCKHKHF